MEEVQDHDSCKVETDKGRGLACLTGLRLYNVGKTLA